MLLRLLLLIFRILAAALPVILLILAILLVIRIIKHSLDEYKNHMFKGEMLRYNGKLPKLILSTAAAVLLIPLILWFFPITTYYIFDPDNVIVSSNADFPDDGKLYLTSGSVLHCYDGEFSIIPSFKPPIMICNRLDDKHIIVRCMRGFSFLSKSHAYKAIIIDYNESGYNYHSVNDIKTNTSYPWN